MHNCIAIDRFRLLKVWIIDSSTSSWLLDISCPFENCVLPFAITMYWTCFHCRWSSVVFVSSKESNSDIATLSLLLWVDIWNARRTFLPFLDVLVANLSKNFHIAVKRHNNCCCVTYLDIDWHVESSCKICTLLYACWFRI